MATAKLPVELPGGKEAGQTMNDLIKSAVILNREMKNLAVGTQEFGDKQTELKEVNNRLAEIRSQTKGVSEASEELKKNFSNFAPIRELQELGEKITGVTKSVGGLTTGFGGLSKGMAAIGIGALIGGLTALAGWLKNTQEGAVLLDTASNALEITFGKLFKFLERPITNFWQWAQRPITNTYNAIKDTIEESKELAKLEHETESIRYQILK